MSKMNGWSEIAAFWGLILEKVGQKPDFWARTREIGPFLAAILPEKANLDEIAAQNAAIITDGQKKLRTGSAMSGFMQRQCPLGPLFSPRAPVHIATRSAFFPFKIH
ncbi:hypothetical protein [Paenibacillus faecis]|uniref:hypothetical protein n=1 Tax=Paenibacillus faecis TaxID=862114 RepID=UPI001BCE93D7|nr:hypothetical protein [Paenibacillus faecis]